ncbi:hypothetical protein PHJA_001997000 [Phtheirospermum japonicum]|uniref:Uncharacterized protein n=1 Tax=Phtheirospermum japonicum TaxID=374723 RepID=A0A830CWB4_9LAMI|nr:hypothetical protein PHJA_001997000 [Phtheirospermum japonicum]
MAKQLPITTNPSHLLQIQAAHRHLSLFLHPQPPPPQSVVIPSPQPENSVSSAVGGGDEPMEMGDDEDEQNSRAVEKLSPSAAAVAERRRSYENVAMLDSDVSSSLHEPAKPPVRTGGQRLTEPLTTIRTVIVTANKAVQLRKYIGLEEAVDGLAAVEGRGVVAAAATKRS